MNKLRIATLAAWVLAGPAFAVGLLAPQEFVTRASAAGQAEVDLGKLALERSIAADIRAFAQKMVDDHGRARTELAALAKAKGLKVALPTEAQRAAMADLRLKTGKEFDTAYAEQMVKDHDEAVTLFSAAGTLEDAELVTFARKMLPLLTGHQELARHLGQPR